MRYPRQRQQDDSKTNPQWVRDFLTRHQSGLSNLSKREAGKYL
ncbi:MAG: DNA alkylation repair protein [Coriobacteriales bacterium]|jgi:hypothetical protein|nr:DNA alkylation repair protein [Coriobacteriales bacterium]